ncbi:hypothetical protein LCGC14_2537540 [marine sediment metagenome]|uniref:dATP/dGTP diphosphohydrolase N-terminal domain-containing protein n=1 Tax=marine sediment metagenome TaxID=412755 RepID=A0A0F9D3C0_9ZZZZ
MSEGTKHDQGKLRYDLIPPDVMDEVAFVLTHGAQKYGDRNWELGIEHSRTIAAAERHIAAFKAREQLDADGNTHHLANAIVELMFTLAHDLRSTEGTDDRGQQVTLHRRQDATP